MNSFLRLSILGLLALLPAGCDETITGLSPNRERVAGAPVQAGDYAPDFLISGAQGDSMRFSSIRGDVTILTIVTAPKEGKPAVSSPLLDLALRLSDVDVDVKYVIVSHPPGAQFTPDATVTLDSITNHRRLVILTDPQALVGTFYGVGKQDTYFVIDDNSQIAGTGDVADVAGIKKALDTVTRKAGMDNSIFNQP